METLLFTTRGTTNLSLNGVSFAMDGVDDFLDTVMSIDNQDLLLKMEGYAVQGIKGEINSLEFSITKTQTILQVWRRITISMFHMSVAPSVIS